MAALPTHPLLSLPDDQIIQKLGEMSLEEILKFSLISERCKILVTSAGIKGDSFRVFIGSKITITISIRTKSNDVQLHYYREPDIYWGVGAYGRKKKLTEPQSVIVEVICYRSDNEDTTSELEETGFTIKNWLEHLQEIFNYPKITYIRFSEHSSQFDIDDIKEVFGNTTEVKIQDTGCHVFNQMILEKFDNVEELQIKASDLPNSKIPERILVRNVGLHIGDYLEETTVMSLDQLLIINSKETYIEGLQMSAKQFNGFIKLWQRGSNPRLEWLAIHYAHARADDNSVIMRGIEHSVIPMSTIRKFKRPGNEEPHEIEGGMDIYRIDGVKATISHTFSSVEILIALLSPAVIMAQASTHPFLSLPDDQIIQKLREMSLEEILKFSLISERCKILVTSAGIKGNSFRVSIGSRITITVFTKKILNHLQFHYYQEPDMYWGMGSYGRKKKLTEPQSVIVEVTNYSSDNEDTNSELEATGFTMKNWLEHLQDIFSYPKIDYIRFFEDSSEFDIDDIKEVFGNTTEVMIQNTGCRVFNQMIFEKLNHIKELRIKNSSFPNSEFPEKILMKNSVGLQIGNALEEFTNMSLDQLLIINSKKLIIEGLQMSAKQFNKFIKLWQRGSNPRLEWLAIHYTGAREDDESVIMGGIEHSVVPTNTIRKFKRPGNAEPYLIVGGMDIHRIDGMKATIRFTSLHAPFSWWEMYVWFDHCVVES